MKMIVRNPFVALDLEAARVPFESTKRPFDAVSRSVAQSECTQEALKVKRTGANVS